MKVTSQIHTPAALLRGMLSWYLLNRTLGGLQSQYGRFVVRRNLLPLHGIDPLFVCCLVHRLVTISGYTTSAIDRGNLEHVGLLINNRRHTQIKNWPFNLPYRFPYLNLVPSMSNQSYRS